MNLFDLMAKLTLDSSEYESGLSKSQKLAKGFASGVKKGFGTAVKMGTAVAGSATAVAGGFAKMATSTANAGDKVDKMSQKLGISAEGYQKWDYVMNLAGTSMSSMTVGLKTLTNQLGKAKDGNKDSQEAFKKLGISMKEASKMSREELFEKSIKGLQGMKDSTDRAALANQLFGKSGQNLTPLFNESAKSTKKLMEQAEKYGMVMSDKAVKASAKFNDSLTTLKGTTEGFKNRMMAQFLPSMTKVTDGIAMMFAGDTDKGIKKIEKGINQFIKKMDKIAPKVLDMGKKILSALADGIVQSMPQLAEQGTKMITSLIQYVTENLPQLVDMGIKVIGTVGQGLLDALPQLLAMLPPMLEQIGAVLASYDWATIGKQVVESLGTALLAIVDVGGQIFMMLYNAVMAQLKKLWSKATEQASKIVSDFGKKISQLPSKVLAHLNKLRANALNAMNNFKTALGNGAKNAVNAVVNFLKTLPSRAYSAIQGVITKAQTWGADIVKGIGTGIKNAIANLTQPLTSVASKIKSFLHFTEPDVGPLKDFHTYMPDMIDLMIEGIEKNQDKLGKALESMASELVEPLDLEASFAPLDYTTAPVEGVETEIIETDPNTERIADMLASFIPQMLQAMDVNIYLDKRVLVGQLVPSMDSELGRIASRKNRGI